MRDKMASLVVDQVKYIYSVKVSADVIKIIVYRSSEKVPVFTVYVNYVEAWGFDVYRPKMTEILIRYYLEHGSADNRKIRLCEHQQLFRDLLDCFFQDAEDAMRVDFVEKCRKWDAGG